MIPAKTVLITGANSGIGLETSIELARHGYTVFAGVRSHRSSDTSRLQEAIESLRLPITVIELDITSDTSVHRAMKELQKMTSSIDILVNNAGFGFIGPVEDFTMTEIQQQFDTNYFGHIRMIRQVVPMMRKKGSGLIINISSINGLVTFPLYGIYSASKFALETTSEALRFELEQFGIYVVVIEPGTFKTNFTKNRKHPARSLTAQSPYRHNTSRFFRRLDSFKQQSILPQFHPQRVARLIYDISRKDRPNLRYKIGTDARILHMLDRFVPKWVKFAMLKRAYGWKS